MPKTENKQEVVVREIKVERAIVTVEGKSDLVLNKMNASNTRQLLAEDRKAQAVWEAQHKNKWENIITSMHWKKPIPIIGDNSDGLATNRECNEEMFWSMLDSANNAPCISAFGLKKS